MALSTGLAVNGGGNYPALSLLQGAGRASTQEADTRHELTAQAPLEGDTFTLSSLLGLGGKRKVRVLTPEQAQQHDLLLKKARKKQAEAEKIRTAQDKLDNAMKPMYDFLKQFQPKDWRTVLPARLVKVIDKRLDLIGVLSEQLTAQALSINSKGQEWASVGSSMLNGDKPYPAEEVAAAVNEPENAFKPETLEKLDKTMATIGKAFGADTQVILKVYQLDQKIELLEKRQPQVDPKVMALLKKARESFEAYFENSAALLTSLSDMPDLILQSDPATNNGQALDETTAAELADKTDQAQQLIDNNQKTLKTDLKKAYDELKKQHQDLIEDKTLIKDSEEDKTLKEVEAFMSETNDSYAMPEEKADSQEKPETTMNRV